MTYSVLMGTLNPTHSLTPMRTGTSRLAARCRVHWADHWQILHGVQAMRGKVFMGRVHLTVSQCSVRCTCVHLTVSQCSVRCMYI